MKNQHNYITRKKLEMILENLEPFYEPNFKLEQHCLNSRSASDFLFIASFSFNDIRDKTVIDLGSGTGILAIGAVLLGARKVYAVDIDENAIKIGMENAKKLGVNKNIKWINDDIENFNIKGDTVLQNPPFGIRSIKKHTDLIFLEKAISISNTCYSIHKAGKKNKIFLTKFINKLNANVTHIIPIKIKIPKIYYFHRKKKIEVNVDLYRIVKK